MSDLLVGLLTAVLSTNPPVAVSNLVAERTGISIQIVNTNDPVDMACQKILRDDADAEKDVQKWTDDARSFAGAGAEDQRLALDARVQKRLAGIKAEYEAFILQHPTHARIRLAYSRFLNETNDEEGALAECAKACELDPNNPAAWNELANYYNDLGPAKKAFECFGKAMALDGTRSIYYRNLAESVYSHNKDACDYYHLTEQQVIDKVLELYRKAIDLDPDNFALFTDYAESFYKIRPPRWQDGLTAWTQALKVARDDVEREGVYVHLARMNFNLGQYEEVRRNLNEVTNSIYTVLKKRINQRVSDVITKGAAATPFD